MVHGDVRVVAESKRELPRESGVELYAVQARALWREQRGDGAVARAYFDDGTCAHVAKRRRDPPAGIFVDKKILA